MYTLQVDTALTNLQELFTNKYLFIIMACSLLVMLYISEFLPDALENNCGKCTPKQKDGAKKVIKYLVKNKPDIWEKALKKFDPQGIYMTKYAAEYEKIKNE